MKLNTYLFGKYPIFLYEPDLQKNLPNQGYKYIKICDENCWIDNEVQKGFDSSQSDKKLVLRETENENESRLVVIRILKNVVSTLRKTGLNDSD